MELLTGEEVQGKIRAERQSDHWQGGDLGWGERWGVTAKASNGDYALEGNRERRQVAQTGSAPSSSLTVTGTRQRKYQ